MNDTNKKQLFQGRDAILFERQGRRQVVNVGLLVAASGVGLPY